LPELVRESTQKKGGNGDSNRVAGLFKGRQEVAIGLVINREYLREEDGKNSGFFGDFAGWVGGVGGWRVGVLLPSFGLGKLTARARARL
jgi:hypothetical protein